MNAWKIAIGCDPNGLELKRAIMELFDRKQIMYEDFGSEDLIYANTAQKVAQKVSDHTYDRGLLICGTGLGVSIAANKVPGAYAAPCYDAYAVERSIKSNNANILTLGFQVTGIQLALKLVEIWLETVYEEGTRSEPKIKRIYEIEHSYMHKG
jgi:RpiB/LacA/LacB family sugar-phosphate isomerase